MTRNLTDLEINSTNTSKVYNFYRKEQITFLTTLLIAILVGNSVVLLAIGLSKQRHKSRMNFFIMHLAIADLLVGLISVLTDLIWKFTLEWHAGNIMCKSVRYGQAVVIYASTYVLVALSIDRLDAIVRPMNFLGSSLRAKILIGLAWTLSAIFCLPMLFLNCTVVNSDGITLCRIIIALKWKWQLYVTLISVSLFIIPAFIIAGCYATIVYTIWKKTKLLGSTHAALRNLGTSAATSKPRTAYRTAYLGGRTGIQRECSISSRGIIPQAKIKTVKMTFVIVIAFILCWSPYFVFDLMDVFGLVHMERARHTAVSIFIQSLAPLNSVANPVIFYIFSATIPRSIRRTWYYNWFVSCVFGCCCSGFCRKHEDSNYQGTATGAGAAPNVTTVVMTICDDVTDHNSITVHQVARQSGSRRRQSGPPRVRTQLNEQEKEILMTSLKEKAARSY